VKLKHVPISDYYIDLKKMYGFPEVLEMLTEELWKIMNKNATCIAAQGYGGTPVASIIAKDYKLHLILVRDEPKQHGPKKGEMLDGYIPTEKDTVNVYDDVLTTGKSLDEIRKSIEPTGAKILEYVVGFKRAEPKFHLSPLKCLFEAKDIL
jgi:orotate phosphoribosyltransferase